MIAVFRTDTLLLEHVRDQLRLVAPRSVELRAVNAREVLREIEVAHDPLGEGRRLRRDDAQPMATLAEHRERLGYSGIDLILEQAHRAEPLAIESDRVHHLVVGRVSEQLAERRRERRTDVTQQRGRIRRSTPQALERMRDAARDADTRIGQGPVQVDQQILA
jgi:hypothetical protein